MYKTIASLNGDVKIYDGKLGYENLFKLTGEMPKNIEHIEVLHNDSDFGDFYSWSNKIVENNFGSNFKEGFPIVNFSKDGSEVEVITAYGELENGVSVLLDKDNLEWVVEFAEGGKIGKSKLKVNESFGDWAITRYEPVTYNDDSTLSGGIIKLVNQDTFDDVVIRNDRALRNNVWFISYKNIKIEDKSPIKVIEKFLKVYESEFENGGSLDCGCNHTMEGGGEIGNPNENFIKWFVGWYKSEVYKVMNITISIPVLDYDFGIKAKQNEIVILDWFEKIDQNINANQYLKKICEKADEYGVYIIAEPVTTEKIIKSNPRDLLIKTTKEFLKKYYKSFGFESFEGKDFMVRKPLHTMEQGGEINHEETYKKWKSLVNMSKSELENFYNSEEGKEAGLSSKKANELGIHSGRESARWIMKMKDTPHKDWTPKMWEWAKRQISFISRMSGNKGGLYDDKGNKTRKHTSLLIWGHNPKKYEGGGIFGVGGDVESRKKEMQSENDKLIKRKRELANDRDDVVTGEGKYKNFGKKERDAKLEEIRNEVNGIDSKQVALQKELKVIEAKETGVVELFDHPSTNHGSTNTIIYDINNDKLVERENVVRGKTNDISIEDAAKQKFAKTLRGANQREINEAYTNKVKEKYESEITDEINKYKAEQSLKETPKVYEVGGTISQTPAPKEDKVYGSKVNAKGSSKDTESAKEIKFDAKTLLSINDKVREHNKQHPNKKITLASAKAVVRRGMGAYSSTHRPTISGGKPNSRVAWGLARLNAFMYKIINGKSKSGKYKQDDDLINELGYSVKSYEDGGTIESVFGNEILEISKQTGIKFTKSKNTNSWYGGNGYYDRIRLSDHISKFDEKSKSNNLGTSIDLNLTYYSTDAIIHLLNNTDPFANYKKGDKITHSYSQIGDVIYLSSDYEKGYVEVETKDNRVVKYDMNKFLGKENNFEQGGSLELIAPNGEPSNLTPEQYKLVRTPQFKSWFGDWENDPQNASKIVDENGEPLVCYHRTDKKFTIFDKEKLGQTSGWATAYFGFYFSNKNQRGSYGKKIIKCFLSIKTPYFIETETYSDFDYEYKRFDPSNFKNNDGVFIQVQRLVFDEKADKHFVAFEPNQIKLADGTNTTFDAENPDIRYEVGGNVGLDNIALKDETPILATPVILSSNGLPDLDIVSSKEAYQALESEIGGDKGVVDNKIRTIPIQEYDVYSNKRSKQIAEQIEENGWIEPLIVSYDKNGNVYIVEGQHRAAALKELGYDKAPVIVIHEKGFGEQQKEGINYAKGGIIEVVLNEGNGVVINKLFNQWNNIKNEKDFDNWAEKVRETKFGTYGTIGLLELLDRFDFKNSKNVNSIQKDNFIKEVKSALNNYAKGGGIETTEKLEFYKVGINNKTERAESNGYFFDVSRRFDYLNKVVGADLTIKKKNSDNRTFSILKIFSDYKTISEAKKDAPNKLKEIMGNDLGLQIVNNKGYSNIHTKQKYNYSENSDFDYHFTFVKSKGGFDKINQSEPFAIGYFGDNQSNRYEYAVASSDIKEIVDLIKNFDNQEGIVEVYNPKTKEIISFTIYPFDNEYTNDSVGLSNYAKGGEVSDWDFEFTGGNNKGQKFSQQQIETIDVYDDNIYSLLFVNGSVFDAKTSETIGLLSITDNVVKLAVILGDNVRSDQKIIRRLQKLAEDSDRVIVENNSQLRSEKRLYPFLLVSKNDATNYTIAEQFQGKLDTPKKALSKKLVQDAIDSGSFLKQIKEGRDVKGVIEIIKSNGLNVPIEILEYDNKEYAKGSLFKPHKTIEQIAKEKNVSLQYANEQLAKGIKIESEHSNSIDVQKTIALQHLDEMIDYYQKLEIMEQPKDIDKYYGSIKRSYSNGGEVDSIYTFPTPTGAYTMLQYVQQVLVRTTEFKKYFGDWELAAKNFLADKRTNFEKHYKNVSKVINLITLEPLVVYHGSSAMKEFFEFDAVAKNQEGRPYAYFADNIQYSQNFVPSISQRLLRGDAKALLYKAFIKINNPFFALGSEFEQIRKNKDGWILTLTQKIYADKEGGVMDEAVFNDYLKATKSQLEKYFEDTFANRDFLFWNIMSKDFNKTFKTFLIVNGYDGVRYSEEFDPTNYDENNPAQFTKAWTIFDASQVKLADGRNINFDPMNKDIRFEEGGDIKEPDIVVDVQPQSRASELRNKIGLKMDAGGFLLGKKDGKLIAHNDGDLGGIFVGKRHSEGGIEGINKATGQPIEVEGEEIQLNSKAVSDSTLKEFNGKKMTNREILSHLNVEGGGKSFKMGGEIEDKLEKGASIKNVGKGNPIEYSGGEVILTRGAVSSDKKYDYNGKMMTTREIASEMNVENGGVSFKAGGNIPQKTHNFVSDTLEKSNDAIDYVNDFINRVYG